MRRGDDSRVERKIGDEHTCGVDLDEAVVVCLVAAIGVALPVLELPVLALLDP
jgi:hypothetical protein